MCNTVMVVILKNSSRIFLGKLRKTARKLAPHKPIFCCHSNGLLICQPSLLRIKNINCEWVKWPSVAGCCDCIEFRYNKTLCLLSLETSSYWGLVIIVKCSTLKQHRFCRNSCNYQQDNTLPESCSRNLPLEWNASLNSDRVSVVYFSQFSEA